MASIQERPQTDGTIEYDVIWTNPDTGMRTRYEADSKADAMRFKRELEGS